MLSWRHYQKIIKCYYAGNVRNMVLHANAATPRKHIAFCGLYNAVSGNHSVQKSPWEDGVL